MAIRIGNLADSNLMSRNSAMPITRNSGIARASTCHAGRRRDGQIACTGAQRGYGCEQHGNGHLVASRHDQNMPRASLSAAAPASGSRQRDSVARVRGRALASALVGMSGLRCSRAIRRGGDRVAASRRAATKLTRSSTKADSPSAARAER